MEQLNLPPFYIGQKVIANCNHMQGAFKKGDAFVILGIIKKCCHFVVNVGIKSRGLNWQCRDCSNKFTSDGIWWLRWSSFSPVQESPFPSLTYSKVVEKESELISLN